MLAAMVWIWFIQSRLTRLWCLSVCDFLSTTPYDIHKLNKKLHGLVFLPTTHFKIVSRQFFLRSKLFLPLKWTVIRRDRTFVIIVEFSILVMINLLKCTRWFRRRKKSQLYPSTFKVYPHFTPGGFFVGLQHTYCNKCVDNAFWKWLYSPLL